MTNFESCKTCGYNNCNFINYAVQEIYCCWCYTKLYGNHASNPCCFSNWQEKYGCYTVIGDYPVRTKPQQGYSKQLEQYLLENNPKKPAQRMNNK